MTGQSWTEDFGFFFLSPRGTWRRAGYGAPGRQAGECGAAYVRRLQDEGWLIGRFASAKRREGGLLEHRSNVKGFH
jgi:hypothetical protein